MLLFRQNRYLAELNIRGFMRSGLIVFIVSFGIIGPALAQTKTPKYSNEFLSIGVVARSLGLAGSHTAWVDDASAGYWNPAGLLQIKDQYQVAGMHAEYFAGIAKFDFMSFAARIDSSSHLGVSLIRFGVDDIPDTRFLYDANGAINYDNVLFFSAADYALLLSYARKLNVLNGLNVGGNMKVIHRVAGKFASAWGFGLDAGAQGNIGKWRYGIMLRDITGTFNAWSHDASLVADVYNDTGNIIPENTVEITVPKANLGVARNFRFKEEAIGLTTSADLRLTFDGTRNVAIRSAIVSVDPSIGLEFDYKQIAFLRIGFGNVQRSKNFDGSYRAEFQPNMGLGVKINRLMIDYALTDITDQSAALYSHVFSLTFGFDKL